MGKIDADHIPELGDDQFKKGFQLQ